MLNHELRLEVEGEWCPPVSLPVSLRGLARVKEVSAEHLVVLEPGSLAFRHNQAMNIGDLGVAHLALVVSLLSLGWQVVSWKSGGAQLKIGAIHGVTPGGAYGDQPIECIMISVANSGRLATTVSQVNFLRKKHWWSRKGGTVVFFQPALVVGEFPRRFDAGDEATFAIRVESIVEMLDKDGIEVSELMPRAVTGHREFVGRLRKPGRMLLERRLEEYRAMQIESEGDRL